LVLSAQRSGSSAVAGALHRLGVDMGEGHLQVADILNPSGYVEDLRVARINKSVAGSGYEVRWGEVKPRHVNLYRAWIEKRATAPIWGAKQPRFVFTFNSIAPLFAELSVDLRVVVARRNVEAIVRSFHSYTGKAYGGRWRMREEEARAHVMKFVDALEWQLERWDGPIYEVDYDQLLAEPVSELLGLHDYCYEDLDVPDHERVVTPALNWLDAELRHHYVGDRPDVGQDDGDDGGESSAPLGWTRKRPCRGCGGRNKERVDEEREPAPAVDVEPADEPEPTAEPDPDVDGDG